MSLGQETLPQFLIVVDFAIEDNPDGAIFIRDRLMATFEVDDGESTKTQPYRAREVVALIIGTAMMNRVRHGLHKQGDTLVSGSNIQFSADTTHIRLT